MRVVDPGNVRLIERVGNHPTGWLNKAKAKAKAEAKEQAEEQAEEEAKYF